MNGLDKMVKGVLGMLLSLGLLAHAEERQQAAPAGSAQTRMTRMAEAAGTEAVIHKLEFRQAKMVDVIRALADMSGLNIVATEEAAKKEVTVFLQNITVRDALDTISKNAGLWYRQDKNSKTYRVMTTEEYQKDMVVYREDTTRIFNLLHPNPVIVATAIQDIYGPRVFLTLGVEDTTGLGALGVGALGGGGGILGNTAITTGTRTRTGLGGARQATTRQTGANYSTIRPQGARGATNRDQRSEQLVDEKLTPDQLERLSSVVQEGSGVVSSEVISQLSGREQPIYVTVNREHNLIIVRTSDLDALKDIERLIREMDRPTPQVLLEMKVLELAAGDSFRQLFSLSGSSADGKHSLGLGNFPPEGGTLVYQYLNKLISARLELLEKENRVNTLSSPILLASNNKPAQVFVGEERVIVTGVTVNPATVTNGIAIPATVTPVTEIRNIGNTLLILPKINADRSVTLDIVQDASSVNEGGATLPVVVGGTVQDFQIDTVTTSNIQGTVVAKDGLTVAIGGLIKSSRSRNQTKVPFLSDIPLVGELFKRREDADSKSELILLITPRIITNPSESEAVTLEQVLPLTEQVLE